MKTFLAFFFLSAVTLFLSSIVEAQPSSGDDIYPYLKQGASPVFGTDVVIHHAPDRDQRNIAICSAFNGWLYAVYSYYNGNQPRVTFLRSKDQGIIWNELLDASSYSPDNVVTKLDIIAYGDNVDSLKIYMIEAVYNPTKPGDWGWVWVGRYKGEPFVGEELLLEDLTGWNTDIAIASDNDYPAINSIPYSLAVAYTKHGEKDSLLFYSSSNGGVSFDDRKVVTVSDHSLEKVSLSYGRSSSKPEGRYFVAWEEKDSQAAEFGHVYTAHSEPNFNSSFTTPVCLDSTEQTAINQVRFPSIACQASDMDNDSSNLTEVILVEKYHQESGFCEPIGFYNKQASSSEFFWNFQVASSSNHAIQPDIEFNPYDSTFILTYFNSTEKRLPYLKNNVNLTNPNSWIIVSDGYNDNTDLISPLPGVKLNYFHQTGMNSWIGNGQGNNGIAYFDSPFNPYVGIEENHLMDQIIRHGSYPNPCSSEIYIWFESRLAENVQIKVCDVLGNVLIETIDQKYPAGKSTVKLTVSSFTPGLYYYIIHYSDRFITDKMIVSR